MCSAWRPSYYPEHGELLSGPRQLALVFACDAAQAALMMKEGVVLLVHLSMANGHSSGDWQFEQSVAMALPTVILKAGWSSGSPCFHSPTFRW
jgi:hypothetical protein